MLRMIMILVVSLFPVMPRDLAIAQEDVAGKEKAVTVKPIEFNTEQILKITCKLHDHPLREIFGNTEWI